MSTASKSSSDSTVPSIDSTSAEGDLLVAVGGELVEGADGVAESSGRAAGDGGQARLVDLDLLGGGDLLQHLEHHAGIGAAELESLTA